MKQFMSCILMGMLGIAMAFAQPIIVVLGNHPDALMLKHQIVRYLDQLDVRENIHLSLSFSNSMPDQLQGMTLCLNSPPPPAYQIIRIWMDARLKKSELDFALAHEMVHVKQYAKRELVALDPQQMQWKGRMFINLRPADRWLAPWEHEAKRMSSQIAHISKEPMKAPLTASQKRP